MKHEILKFESPTLDEAFASRDVVVVLNGQALAADELKDIDVHMLYEHADIRIHDSQLCIVVMNGVIGLRTPIDVKDALRKNPFWYGTIINGVRRSSMYPTDPYLPSSDAYSFIEKEYMKENSVRNELGIIE